jgi:uncharacterized membrane protein (DUF485 family)
LHGPPALKGILGRKLRTALTAIAIVLGVAMVAGTFMLTGLHRQGVRLDLHRRQERVERGSRVIGAGLALPQSSARLIP